MKTQHPSPDAGDIQHTSICSQTLLSKLTKAAHREMRKYARVCSAGAAALGEGLELSSTLQSLRVGWAGLADSGAQHLAQGLQSSRSLQLLDLSGNNAGSGTC